MNAWTIERTKDRLPARHIRTKRRHGKLVGYVVVSRNGGVGGITTACHGETHKGGILLYGNVGTLFPTSKAAQQQIELTRELDPGFARWLSVMPVAPLAG